MWNTTVYLLLPLRARGTWECEIKQKMNLPEWNETKKNREKKNEPKQIRLEEETKSGVFAKSHHEFPSLSVLVYD